MTREDRAGRAEEAVRTRAAPLRSLHRTVAVAWHLGSRDVARRYSRLVLGMVWGILTPLCLAVIIGIVFGTLYGLEPRRVLPYLFLNLTLWGFLAASVNTGATAFIGAEGYIKQIPRLSLFVFPLRVVLAAFLSLLLGLGAAVLLAIVFGNHRPAPAWLLVLPALAAWLAFAFSAACVSGVVNTAVRDFAQVQALLLQVLFYATPVIYPAQMLVDRGMGRLLRWNPLYHLLVLVQVPLLDGHPPPARNVLAVFLSLTVLLPLAVLTVRMARRRLVFWL